MPALSHGSAMARANSAGRRWTSLEGGNRGMPPVRFGEPTRLWGFECSQSSNRRRSGQPTEQEHRSHGRCWGGGAGFLEDAWGEKPGYSSARQSRPLRRISSPCSRSSLQAAPLRNRLSPWPFSIRTAASRSAGRGVRSLLKRRVTDPFQRYDPRAASGRRGVERKAYLTASQTVLPSNRPKSIALGPPWAAPSALYVKLSVGTKTATHHKETFHATACSNDHRCRLRGCGR